MKMKINNDRWKNERLIDFISVSWRLSKWSTINFEGRSISRDGLFGGGSGSTLDDHIAIITTISQWNTSEMALDLNLCKLRIHTLLFLYIQQVRRLRNRPTNKRESRKYFNLTLLITMFVGIIIVIIITIHLKC